MYESAKTNKIRGAHFNSSFLSGKVIDIGAGEDLVCAWAEKFDKDEGDARRVTLYRAKESYDSVHSSHCLEHMPDPEASLSDWWQLVKPGGVLVIVVPDEDLYEQGYWPSIFNVDYKCTFRLDKNSSWSPVSWDIRALVESLPNSVLIEACIQDANYDHRLKQIYPPRRIAPFRGYSRLRRFIDLTPLKYIFNETFFQNFECRWFGKPIDQTMGAALAQIQIIARKKTSGEQ